MTTRKVISDPLQLRNAKFPREFVYLTAECPRADNIVFVAEHTLYDVTMQDNETVRTTRIDACDFSAWWIRMQREGWRAKR